MEREEREGGERNERRDRAEGHSLPSLSEILISRSVACILIVLS